jgi:hypothetical protein
MPLSQSIKTHIEGRCGGWGRLFLTKQGDEVSPQTKIFKHPSEFSSHSTCMVQVTAERSNRAGYKPKNTGTLQQSTGSYWKSHWAKLEQKLKLGEVLSNWEKRSWGKATINGKVLIIWPLILRSHNAFLDKDKELVVWYINVAQRIRNDSADKSAWVEAADREKNLKSE